MALEISKFNIGSIQATIFTPGLTFIQSKVLSYLLTEWGDMFNGSPMSLPLAEEAPADVPRILIESADKYHKIEVSPNRVNIFWIRIKPEDEATLDFYNMVPKIFEGYKNTTSAQIGRLAGIITRIAAVGDPALFIARLYCKEELVNTIFKNPESFEIHCHKRYIFTGDFNINSWIRFKTGLIEPKGKKQKVIYVQQDINTLNEELTTNDFNETSIKKFFKHIPDEMDSILNSFLSLDK